MKKGDKVMIIPNAEHAEHVKEHYGKILEIEKVLISDKKGNFYKIKGIKDYAREEDLLLSFPMKVFKFYSGDLHYAYSGHNQEEAKKNLFDEVGEMVIDKIEEIPESEWDKKIIKMWEDNDREKKPYKVSIRENMFGDTPTQIFTNDLDF